MKSRRVIAVGREVVREMRAHNVTFMAGSIAHAAFLWLLPLLVLLLVIASAVGNDLLSEHIVALSRTYLSPPARGRSSTGWSCSSPSPSERLALASPRRPSC